MLKKAPICSFCEIRVDGRFLQVKGGPTICEACIRMAYTYISVSDVVTAPEPVAPRADS